MTADEVTEVTQQAVQKTNQFVDYFESQIPELMGFGIKVVIAIIVFFIGRIFIKWMRKLVRKSLERTNADMGVGQFVDSVLKVGLYILLIFSIAAKLGVDTTSVAALIASGGVAIGLALQGSLSNFAGGVLILLLKPFVVGDYIIEDSEKNEGTVKEIQIFYTKLTTIDNKTIVIPNGMLTNNSLTNATAKDERQLDLKIHISYRADLRKTKAIIRQILEEDSCTLKSDEMNVFVHELADSAVILGVRAWVKNSEFWTTKWRLLEEIKLTLEQNGIEIPHQQLTVHMQDRR